MDNRTSWGLHGAPFPEIDTSVGELQGVMGSHVRVTAKTPSRSVRLDGKSRVFMPKEAFGAPHFKISVIILTL